MKKGLLVSILLLVIGLALCGLAIYSYASYKSFSASAVETTGTVADIKWSCISGGIACQNVLNPALTGPGNKNWTAYPVVTFTTADGRTIFFTSDVGGNPAPYGTGQTVKVLYSPQNPENAEIAGSIWLKVCILGILGLVAFLIGLLGTVTTIRHSNDQNLTPGTTT